MKIECTRTVPFQVSHACATEQKICRYPLWLCWYRAGVTSEKNKRLDGRVDLRTSSFLMKGSNHLYYARNAVLSRGIEPRSPAWQGWILATVLWRNAQSTQEVTPTVLEPATFGFKDQCSATEIRNYNFSVSSSNIYIGMKRVTPAVSCRTLRQETQTRISQMIVTGKDNRMLVEASVLGWVTIRGMAWHASGVLLLRVRGVASKLRFCLSILSFVRSSSTVRLLCRQLRSIAIRIRSGSIPWCLACKL